MLVIDRRKALSIPPLWRLAFRPFFLFGSLLALLAVPLWVAVWTGQLGGWQPTGGWLAWHRHEMLYGFGIAIVAGFLLTAVQTWTGRPGVQGWSLMSLALLWLTARLAWLLGAPAWLTIALDGPFLPLLAWLMARQLGAVRQRRNYPIVVVLLLLALTNGQALVGLALANDSVQRHGVLGGIWLVAALMMLIGGRVIPFFTQRGLGRVEAIKPWPWLDIALLVGTALIALAHAFGLADRPQRALAVLLGLLGLGHAIRLVRWHDPALWRVPLLWSLHLAMAWLLVAVLGLAAWHLGLAVTPSAYLHALTVGAMSGLILAMIARVTLGHTGRPLQLPRGVAAAFVLLNLATAARVFLVDRWPLEALWLAAGCFALAFALYAWRYAPMLTRPRVDGHPG